MQSGNEPHDLAGKHDKREGFTPELHGMDRFTCPVSRVLSHQLSLGPGVSALSLLLKAGLRVLRCYPSPLKPRCPLEGDRSCQAGVGTSSLHTYLRESLHVLGQRAHSLPLIMLEQLQDGGVHRVIRWDSPKEVWVLFLIS